MNLGKGKEKGGNKGDGGSSSSSRVGDLASVVQRGRNVVVMVGEKDVRLFHPWDVHGIGFRR